MHFVDHVIMPAMRDKSFVISVNPMRSKVVPKCPCQNPGTSSAFRHLLHTTPGGLVHEKDSLSRFGPKQV
jgi:hypothetical protein